MAESEGTKKVYAAPREIKDPQKLASLLAPLLKKDKEEIFKKISQKEDPWVFLGEVSLDVAEKMKDFIGIHFESNYTRFYPEGKMASHVLGFCNKQNQGQYGIEGYFQEILRGKDGFRRGMVDAQRRPIFSPFNEIKDPIDGADIVLTLDYDIQFFVEGKLDELVKKYKPKSATIIVSNPKTGEILAMASRPAFDPNRYFKVKKIEIFKNPAVQIPFEPGSIFKPITMAGALEEKVVTPQTTYIDKGKIKIGRYTIKNADLKAHGKKTMTQVLEYSLNTGAVFVEQKLGNKKFLEYVKKFGFGKKTGIKLFGEKSGNLSNILHPRSKEKKIEFANASFGQGIMVTPIQIVQAFSAIANQGKMMKPYIVKKIIYPDGKEKIFKPKVARQVLSPETALSLTAMMVSVVKNGYGKKAGVKGYLIAGKTGTAQVPWSYLGIQKPGYSGVTIHSFVGFAPAFDPKFLIFLKMDYPKGVRFAADSLAPVFHDIAEYLFTYFGIPPEK